MMKVIRVVFPLKHPRHRVLNGKAVSTIIYHVKSQSLADGFLIINQID